MNINDDARVFHLQAIRFVGHLTFAGLAELITAGGVVAYLQRSDPSLLKLTAPDAPDLADSGKSGWRSTRPLWMGLALLMVLTPLGLVAAGTAWGEWSAEDFAKPEMRDQITAASGNQTPPPAAPPEGLAKLAGIWTAPFADYAPSFVSSPQFGYILLAMFGAGLIILFFVSIS